MIFLQSILRSASIFTILVMAPATVMASRLSAFTKPVDWAFPLGYRGTLAQKAVAPVRIDFNGSAFVAYRNKTQHLIVHSDVCPHMGASLAKGWVSCRGTLHCPYHGFEFEHGDFVRIPHGASSSSAPLSRAGKRAPTMSVLPTIERGGMHWLWSSAHENQQECARAEPYLPPEHTDPEFRRIEGQVEVAAPAQFVVENLLDMLHISYVHSFGNLQNPVPIHLQYSSLTNTSGRTRFVYTPNINTISRRMGTATNVVVENEFYLPTMTLTRVIAGDIVKTVWTATRPVSETKCILFWRVYRNFWIDPYLPFHSRIGDWLLKWLMERTIAEDQGILAAVHTDRERHVRTSVRTPYDITILKFRQACRLWQLKL